MTPEQEILDLKQRVEELENVIADFSYSSKYIFQKHVQFLDARDITFGSDKGTRIGTSVNHKFAFYGSTPVVQQSSTGEATGVNVGAGNTLTHLATFTGNSGSTAYTISDIVKHLKTLGLLLT